MELNLKNRPVPKSEPLEGDGTGAALPLFSTEEREHPPAVETSNLAKTNHLLRLFLGLVVCFLFFYVCADYTAFTAGQIHPGELVFSNTMIQLWTATYRLAFIFGVSLALIGLVWQGLWQFFKPTAERDFDLVTSIRLDLTPAQRIWLFFIVFFSLCFLFVMLLSVRLPESVSVGP